MKKILSLFLAVSLAASLFVMPAAAAEQFSDLSDPTLAAAAESLRLMGVMDGFSDGSFRPNASLTRAQFCKMAVYAMDGEDELELYRSVTVYPDVKPSHWAAAYINMAAKGKKIIAGFADGRFYPDRTVTMGQAVTILLRLLGYQDESMGGVWPNGYVGVARRIGLLEGVGVSDAGAPLTRGQAARLFVNLLQADCGGESGGSFLSSIGLESKENVVLVSSAAKGPDGKENALGLADGQVYRLTGDKTSSGVLNGNRGVLVLKRGEALTFLPAEGGGGRVVSLSSATALQITDGSGAKYSVDNGTAVFYNGKQQSWSEVYSWLIPGTALTLYLNSAGNVEYIIVGGGSAPTEAVVVYKNGSTEGFSGLTGGAGDWRIYKNGAPASAVDLRAYDVAAYSSATNTIRVCDVRVTGYYEDCRPSPSAAEFVTVMGHEFPVLTTAQASLSAFKPGDQITLLLTEDNQVAGAIRAEDGSSGNIGVAKSVSEGSAEVELLCGVTVRGRTIGSADAGQLVRVASEEKGTLQIFRQGGGTASGALDLNARRLGSYPLAENVMVLTYGDSGLEKTTLSDLGGGTIQGTQISYARLNWAKKVDVVVVGRYRNSAVLYGRTAVTSKRDGETQQRQYYLEVTDGKNTAGPLPLNYDEIHGGDYVAASTNRAGTAFTSVWKLTRFSNVPNSAWTGRSAVTVGGRTYAIASDAVCYNADTETWVTLDAAHAYAEKANLYESGDGVIRVIEVRR